MSSGGGTTTQVTQTELPSWLQDAAQSNLARADFISKLGYVPQYGVDVAGFSPMQTSAMQNTANAASAFGLGAPTDVMAGMPAMTTDPNTGMTGYSSGDLYDSYRANLAQRSPSQFAALNSMFIDPVTGELGVSWNKQGEAVVNPDAQYTTPVFSSDGSIDYSSNSSSLPAGSITANTGMLPQWAEDLALSGATLGPMGTFLSPVSKMLGNFAVDHQMDTLEQQQSVYDNPFYGKSGTAVMTDNRGNTNLVDLSQFSQKGNTIGGAGGTGSGTTIHSGSTGGGVGNSYYSSAGNTWDDYGGYTGVTGSGLDMGNDFKAFSNSGWDGGSGASTSGSGSSSSGGTYCCTAMRKNGDWTSHIKVYRMHKWHYDQPQWWRDGYDVWGKIIADKLITKKGNFWAKCFDAFYEKRIKGGKSTVKSTVAEVIMYPAVFAIGMAKKLTGKHIELVEVGE